jgi:uncharacterized membrane protein YoaK (UPF0700 family)
MFGTFVSFMSGNTTYAGIHIGQAYLTAAIPAGLAIAGFLGGSFLGNWLTHAKIRFSRALLLAIAALLLALFIVASLHHASRPNIGIPLLSFAMGLINPALVRLGSEPISLTFVTGTLNRIGNHLAQATLNVQPANPQGPRDTHLRRALLETTMWTAFFVGAILSAAAASLGVLELLPAWTVLTLFALAFITRE